ncbi:MAG: hypothetical protein AAFN41_02735 [Planctomycetota bacterium]
MSPSTPRSGSNAPKKSLVGLSFAFPMQMPKNGTGAGADQHDPKRQTKPKG